MISKLQIAGGKRKVGFTLVELLVVIAIIGILAGLLFTAINKMMRTARISSARTDMYTIRDAISAYNGVYGKWPAQTQADKDVTYYLGESGDMTDDQNDVIAAMTNNPRDEVFLEISERNFDKFGRYIDPWKRPYVVAVDHDKDGFVKIECKVADGVGVYFKAIPAKVAVISFGPDPSNTNVGHRIYSW